MQEVTSIIFRRGKRFLVAERFGTHAGEFCTPGGKVDPPESVQVGAIREVLEETSCNCRIVRFLEKMVFQGTKEPYEMYFFLGILDGEPRQTEPEKLGPWLWIPYPTERKLTEPTEFILSRITTLDTNPLQPSSP